MDVYEMNDPLVAFLYLLLWDYVTAGVPEKIIEDQGNKEKYTLSNGFLAQHAKDIAMRLQKETLEGE